MIKIGSKSIKKQENFWNHAHFHPTDAIEDAWGKKLIDKYSSDGAVKMIRFYTMFEDIVYLGDDGELLYDFRINDLRMDYLIEKGFDILCTYCYIPDAIAERPMSYYLAQGKVRYKNKAINLSTPTSYEKWEEICLAYTKHLTERYGTDRVSKWFFQCYNEPDCSSFFLGDLGPDDDWRYTKERSAERASHYNKLYFGFQRAIKSVCKDYQVGGCALAGELNFFRNWLDFVKDNKLGLDFISIHTYGTGPKPLNEGTCPVNVENTLKVYDSRFAVIKEKGLENVPLIVDEWGAGTEGVRSITECPKLIYRENEWFSSYYVKLIYEHINRGNKLRRMLICLSGQDRQKFDFSGNRTFLTKNFINKPIYNAYILAGKLGENLLGFETDNKYLSIIPTKLDNGDYSMLFTYSEQLFDESLEDKTETFNFEEDIVGKKITVWAIDRSHSNACRLFEKNGWDYDLTKEQLEVLREEGRLKPVKEFVANQNSFDLTLTANGTYLVTIEK